jgi:uncharacterized protein YceK
MKILHVTRLGLLAAVLVLSSGCASLRAINNAEDGAGAEARAAWARWVDSGGDIAVATTWARKVAPGVTVAHIEQAFTSVAAEHNIKAVGETALSEELEARSGRKEKFLKTYSYCSPATARAMVDFSPHMAAYLPCRIAVVEQEDGLWIYAQNMDMLIKMGRKLPPALHQSVMQVRNAMWTMMEKGAQGDF